MANPSSTPQAILANYFRDLLYDDAAANAEQTAVSASIHSTTSAAARRRTEDWRGASDDSAVVQPQHTPASIGPLPLQHSRPTAPTLLTDRIFTPVPPPQRSSGNASAETPVSMVEAEQATRPHLNESSAESGTETVGYDSSHEDEGTAEREYVDPALLQWLDNGRPPWAQADFDALLLEVDNFTVAVPLTTLGHIQPLTESLTPIFGQAPWFMGIQTGSIQTKNSRKCGVVNTALFIMPERYNATFPQSARFVVSINGLTWALAVTKVDQPIRLRPDQVRWRKDRGKQPWAAGVVKEHMCVLIDIPRLGQMLLDWDA